MAEYFDTKTAETLSTPLRLRRRTDGRKFLSPNLPSFFAHLIERPEFLASERRHLDLGSEWVKNQNYISVLVFERLLFLPLALRKRADGYLS